MIPTPIRFCTLSGVVSDQGEPMENRFVRVRILDGIYAVVGDQILSSAPKSAYTLEDGSFEFTLPRGALARIEIPESGLDATFNVPLKGTAELGDLSLRDYEP